MPACVQLDDVTVVYPNGVQALSDVTITIAEGEFAFLIGPTGHGKSTLLKLLYREEVPTRGQVLVQGWDVAKLSPGRVARLRRRVAVVFQDFRLLPQRTAWENISFALQATGVSFRASLRRIPQALAEVGLLDKADDFPSQLSAGEQQRLAIARALALRPALLLADEATGNLDPQSSTDIMNLLVRANEDGATVVVATHDPTIVNTMRRRVIALHYGRVMSDLPQGIYPDDLGRD
jgi:cell division transport system ATP-binding protein